MGKLINCRLIQAIQKNNIRRLESLLENQYKNHPSIDTETDNEGWSPLCVAVCGNRLRFLELLLEAGANVNYVSEKNAGRWSPLCIAVHYNHLECLELLLKKGANVDHTNAYLQTPLFEAVKYGHLKCIEILLKAGANVNHANPYAQTPLFEAVSDRGIVNKNRVECISILLNAGADFNKSDYLDETPLYQAAKHGYVECTNVLLNAGADFNKSNYRGETPISIAKKRGHNAIVMLLEKEQLNRQLKKVLLAVNPASSQQENILKDGLSQTSKPITFYKDAEANKHLSIDAAVKKPCFNEEQGQKEDSELSYRGN